MSSSPEKSSVAKFYTTHRNDVSQYFSKSGRISRKAPDEWLLGKMEQLKVETSAEAIFLLKNGLTQPLCGWCREKKTSFRGYTKGYTEFCSVSCAFFGADKHQKKIHSLQKNEGISNVFQREQVISSIKKKMTPDRRAEASKKGKMTLREKYQVDFAFQFPSAQQRALEIKQQRWVQRVVKPFVGSDYFFEDLPKNSTEIIDIKHACGRVFQGSFSNGRPPVCPRCYTRSIGQEEVTDFIESLGFSVKRNDRTTIPPAEIDILVNGLAVEYNGDYWHSAKFHDAGYLKQKHGRLAEAGLRLFIIQENQWQGKKEIVKSRLMHALGRSTKVSARQCSLVSLEKSQALKFYSENHLDGAPPGSAIRETFALVYEKQVIMCLSVGKSRWSKLAPDEVVRSCTKLNTAVVGGLSRLSKKLVGSTMTYADLNTGTAEGWARAGWKRCADTAAGYHWIKPKSGERLSRYQTQRSRLAKLFDISLDDEKTESDIMQENGYLKVFNLGNAVYLKGDL
jgi:hypothetical protein